MRNRITATLLLLAANCGAARLSPSAERAYKIYVAELEARLARQHARPETYLAVVSADDGGPNRFERSLMSGDIQLEPLNGGTWQVPGALLHHWRGAAFVPNATPSEMLAVLRDFNQFPRHYAPQVVSARALTDDGQTATLAVRFKEQRVVTIVLDGEYKVESRLSGNDRGYSFSRSLHFWQVDSPGTAQERRRPEGQDDGFLWGLNSYWSFTRVRGGLQMECEAVSLTRDVPVGLGWLVTPVIAELPREELAFTLRATRKALIEYTAQEAN
ncbi:MAG TPA: hypothetical protein VL127_10040 [Bryobacteraceae bacterium]|nr:hypothetical protein [Bryobacteraceae bacterium]